MKTVTILILLLHFVVSSCKPNMQKDAVDTEDPAGHVDLENFNVVPPETVKVFEKLNFGNGYNSVTGTEYFGVMNFEGAKVNAEIMAGARGNSGMVTMEIVESKQQLQESLSISAKAELNFKIWGVKSDNSLKVSSYNETEFNDFSQNAVLKAQYENEPLVMINPTVKEELIELAKRDPETFMRTCGDMFVSRIYTGGELYAIFSLKSRDTREKKKNDVFFKTANEYMGNELKAEVSVEKLSEATNSIKNISTKIITRGGGVTPKTSSLDAFIRYANTFKEEVAADQRAVILYVELAPYEAIAGFPNINFNKIRVDQRNFIDMGTGLYDELQESIENAEFVTKHPELFESYFEEEAQEVLTAYKIKQTELGEVLLGCKTNFEQCDLGYLEDFADFPHFGPDIDFPAWPGEQKELPVTLDSTDWVVLSDDTGDEGTVLSIEGALELRGSEKSNRSYCKDGIYEVHRRLWRNILIKDKNWFWEKAVYENYYEAYVLPHYEIAYINPDNGETLSKFKWLGNPVVAENNVRVSIRFVPGSSWLLNSKHKSVGAKREKQLGYKSTNYTAVTRACHNKAPIATLSAESAAPEDKGPLLQGNNKIQEAKRPALIQEGDVYYYQYVEEEEPLQG